MSQGRDDSTVGLGCDADEACPVAAASKTSRLPGQEDEQGAGDPKAGEEAAVRWLAGPHSPSAFLPVHEAFAPIIRRYCAQALGEACEALDITQDVFIALAKQKDSIRRGAPLLPYLKKIARNKCISRIRKRRRVELVPDVDGEDYFVPAEQSDYTGVERRSQAEMVHVSLSELSAHDQEALLAKHFDGLSLKEMASLSGITVSAAGMRLKRAHDRMRDELARKGVTDSDC